MLLSMDELLIHGCCSVPAEYEDECTVLHNRRVAALGYTIMQTIGNKAALQYFHANVKGGFGGQGNAIRQMKHWGKRFEAHNNLYDARRIGRPSSVPVQDIEACVTELLAGRFVTDAEGNNVWRGWSSLKMASTSGPEHCPTIKRVITEGLSVGRLWVAMTDVSPTLSTARRAADIRAELSDEVKAMREEMSGKHKRLPKWQLDQVIWLDAKKLHITPVTEVKVYMNPEHHPDKNTLQDYKEGFEMVYKQVNTPAVIRKDVAGLTELYSWVHNNRGEMAPKKMR
jgi:hypothetical protein